MSSIRCPNCRHTIALRGVKPGKFQPKCPKCKTPFVLVIPEDAGSSPRATVMPENMTITAQELDLETLSPPPVEVPDAAVSADAEATLPPRETVPPRGTPRNDRSAAREPDFDDDVTAAPPPRREAGRRTRVDPDETAIPVGLSEEMTAELTQRSPYAASPDAPQLHGKLGGYQILKKLGQGGMGAVYLAKQTSLDRNVALKVLSPRLAEDPHFVSRFTREAFAAAQLTHHNVVQIHDIGVEHNDDIDSDTNYFSMEFVVGKTLAGMLKETGKLDPEAAVGYVLQAARGLKFAHDHGLIHRDVKPDNILLNDQGVIKVADLGLVKRTGSAETLPERSSEKDRAVSADQTQTSVAMGTPAYMPPEQARDAAAVDVRADIYSLGCTLYDLLTGRPPFVGRTAAELMTKHANEQIVPPDRLDKHIPDTLSQIVMKMLARKPADRHANMGEVIAALEGWLGVESGKTFSPREEHVKTLETAVNMFNQSKTASLRKFLIRSFFGVCAATVICCMLPMFGHPFYAVGLIGYALATFTVYEIVDGTLHHTFLIGKARQLLLDSSIYDWITYAVVTALAIVVMAVFHVFWIGLLFTVAAIGTALGFYCAVDIPLAGERETPLKQTEKMLRSMRLKGLDENSLRQFICKYSGRHWEEFYENIFGYEAKMMARSAWGRGERARNRPKHAAWREPVIAWMDRKLQAHQEERQQKMLARLESKALQADGMDQVEANRKARRNAERLVQKAAAVRETAMLRATDPAITGSRGSRTAALPAVATNWMHDDSPPPRGHSRREQHESYLRRRYGSPADVATGRLVRFIVATLLLVGFGTWWNENGGAAVMKNTVEMSSSREDATITAARDTVSRAIRTQRDYDINGPGHVPLRVEYVPDWLCDAIGTWNGGLAGALLLLSIFFAGRVLGVTMLLSAAVALFAYRFPIPIVGDHATTAAAASIVMWLLGVVFFRLVGEG